MELPKAEVVIDSKNYVGQQDMLFKIIIIGDTGVGKSCMLSRITENRFREEHNVTIGVEFGNFLLRIEDHIVKL